MKRQNPHTKKPFQKDDVRDDGYVFVSYTISKPLRKNGFFIENWANPERQEPGEKRVNPETQKPFVRGYLDSKTDLIFYSYNRKSRDLDGFCYENWLKPDSYLKAREQTNAASAAAKVKIRKLRNGGGLPKRLNPITKMPFKKGDKGSDGRIFRSYVGQEKTKDGYMGESWKTDLAFLKSKISDARSLAKTRALKKSVEFDLSLKYLISIFPSDSICPALGVEMVWGGDKKTSPSIDRIMPQFGYIEGNVAWISNHANTIKLSRTPVILRKIADWIDEHISGQEA